jgi:hypothetical protein
MMPLVWAVRLLVCFCAGILGGYLLARTDARARAMAALIEEERVRRGKEEARWKRYLADMSWRSGVLLHTLREITWRIARYERASAEWGSSPEGQEVRMASLHATLAELIALAGDQSPLASMGLCVRCASQVCPPTLSAEKCAACGGLGDLESLPLCGVGEMHAAPVDKPEPPR